MTKRSNPNRSVPHPESHVVQVEHTARSMKSMANAHARKRRAAELTLQSTPKKEAMPMRAVTVYERDQVALPGIA